MSAPHNPFKAALKAGKAQIGFWQSLGTPITTEISAMAGFNWLLLDGEHGPIDPPIVRDLLMALKGSGSHAVVRVAEGQTALIKRMLDVGAQSILVPLIDTAEQAEAAAQAMRYPPLGIRGAGVGVVRASGYNTIPDYVTTANDEVCLLVQAETVTALDNLEAICAVEGVDGVFIGPGDLSVSMGLHGQIAHPDVQARIEDGIRRIRAAGKAPGILMADEKFARRYLEIGAQFVAVGSDIGMMVNGTRNLAAKYLGGAEMSSKGQVY